MVAPDNAPMTQPTIYADGREYDRFGCTGSGDDELSFYAAYAANPSAPALELGCGTGRLTIPLAQSGLDMTGIDLGESMLAAARAKCSGAGAKLELIHADFRNFSLGRRFGLILFPNNAIAHLLHVDDLRACLSCVRRHLLDRGKFIIDFFNPSLRLLCREPNVRYPVAEYVDDSGERVAISETVQYDAATQINHGRWYLRRGNVETVRSLDMRMYFPQELEALLFHNGFSVVEKFGDFGRAPFTSESSKQILVCASNDSAP